MEGDFNRINSLNLKWRTTIVIPESSKCTQKNECEKVKLFKLFSFFGCLSMLIKITKDSAASHLFV